MQICTSIQAQLMFVKSQPNNGKLKKISTETQCSLNFWAIIICNADLC